MGVWLINFRKAPQSASGRKWDPGHVLTLSTGAGRRDNYYKVTSTGAPNLLAISGLRHVQVRYHWNLLNPTGNTFDFGPIKSSYADTERSIRADLWRCAQNGTGLIVMVEDKVFAGDANPMPADMAGNTQYVQAITTGSGTGYCAVRWNVDVVARFGALINALGAAFDGDPTWYGIAFQETAIDFTATQRSATGYSDANYRDAQISMLKTASDAFPTSQIFWYTNFMPTPITDYRLEEVADALKTYRNGNSGVNMGGPDILPDDGPISTRCYPRYGAPPVGSFGELKLFCSLQNDSYRTTNLHTTSTPDARVPGATWVNGDQWTMQHLYQFGRDYLKLNHIFWENYTGAGYKFEPDARLVIEGNTTFNEDL